MLSIRRSCGLTQLYQIKIDAQFLYSLASLWNIYALLKWKKNGRMAKFHGHHNFRQSKASNLKWLHVSQPSRRITMLVKNVYFYRPRETPFWDSKLCQISWMVKFWHIMGHPTHRTENSEPLNNFDNASPFFLNHLSAARLAWKSDMWNMCRLMLDLQQY